MRLCLSSLVHVPDLAFEVTLKSTLFILPLNSHPLLRTCRLQDPQPDVIGQRHGYHQPRHQSHADGFHHRHAQVSIPPSRMGSCLLCHAGSTEA